jgi:hypothetical protein
MYICPYVSTPFITVVLGHPEKLNLQLKPNYTIEKCSLQETVIEISALIPYLLGGFGRGWWGINSQRRQRSIVFMYLNYNPTT